MANSRPWDWHAASASLNVANVLKNLYSHGARSAALATTGLMLSRFGEASRAEPWLWLWLRAPPSRRKRGFPPDAATRLAAVPGQSGPAQLADMACALSAPSIHSCPMTCISPCGEKDAFCSTRLLTTKCSSGTYAFCQMCFCSGATRTSILACVCHSVLHCEPFQKGSSFSMGSPAFHGQPAGLRLEHSMSPSVHRIASSMDTPGRLARAPCTSRHDRSGAHESLTS